MTPVVLPPKTPEPTLQAYRNEKELVEMVLAQGAMFYVRHLSVGQVMKLAVVDTDNLIVQADSRPTRPKPRPFPAPQASSPATSSPAASVSVWCFGWAFAAGIMSLLLALPIIALALLPVFLLVVRRWGWTMSFGAALVAFIPLIMVVVFYFSAPGQDTPTFLSQGNMVGTYLALVGSLAAVAGAGADGIAGLTQFVRERSVPSQAHV
jgi:hypothetical protein